MRTRPLWPWITAGVVVLVAVISFCGAVLLIRSHSAPNGSDGALRFAVTDVAKAGVQSDPPPAGEYVIAGVTVTNTGDEQESLVLASQKLIDTQDRRSPAVDGQVVPADHPETTSLTVRPGGVTKVVMRFDVPTGARVTAIELHASASSPGVTVRVHER